MASDLQVASSLSQSSFGMLDMFSGVVPNLKLTQTMPTITEFVNHPDFLGSALTVYPRQQTLLRTIFLEDFTPYDHYVIEDWLAQTAKWEAGADVRIPTDIYERIEWNKAAGRTHFREIIEIGGRRGGKGYIGGIIACYLMYQMLKLDDPQQYFGVERRKDLYINVVATSTSQARKNLFADIKATIMQCNALLPYVWKAQEEEVRIQTPADMRYLAELKKQGVKVNTDIASLRVTANSSSSAAGRGSASFAQMFDELAHAIESESSRSASEIYEAYTPSLAQMGTAALIYVPSSPWTKVGKFYELVEAAFECDTNGDGRYKEMFAIQHPSWAMYEDWQYDKRLRRAVIEKTDPILKSIESRNPTKFKVEYRSRFAETVDAYLDPEVVDAMFSMDPATKKAMWNGKPLEVTMSSSWSTRYRFHCDPGKSQDNFAVAGGHLEDGGDGFQHVVIDYLKLYQPSDFARNPQTGLPWIDYVQVTSDLKKLAEAFPIYKLTFDQWNSVLSIQEIRNHVRAGWTANKEMLVEQHTHTKQENYSRWDMFKNAIYMGWVHAPIEKFNYPGAGEINVLEQELKFLVDKNGRVDHQTTGTITTNDLATAVSVLTVDLLKDQLAALVNDQFNMTSVHGAVSGDYMSDNSARAPQPGQSIAARGRMTQSNDPFGAFYGARGGVRP